VVSRAHVLSFLSILVPPTSRWPPGMPASVIGTTLSSTETFRVMAIEQHGGKAIADEDQRSRSAVVAPARTRPALVGRATALLERLSPVSDADRVGEAVSPHVVTGGGEPRLPASRERGFGGDGERASVLSYVRIGLAITSGFAGSLLIVGTSPVWKGAPPGWRLEVPGLYGLTTGNSFLAAATFVIGVLLMALGWLGLVGHTSRRVGPERQRLKIVIAVVLLWAIPFMLAPIQLSSDAYSYGAQGDLSSLGHDPSVAVIDDLPIKASNPFYKASDSIWRKSPAPYGPVAVGTEKFIVTVTGFDVNNAMWGFRALAVVGTLMTGFGVFVIARKRGVSGPLAIAFAVGNPLVLIHLIGGAHNDALMMGLLLLGMAAFETGRKILAVTFVTLAVCVKLPAVLALAFIAWNWKGKDVDWKERVKAFPVVGAITAGLTAVLCLAAGIGLGWIGALKSTGTVYSTFSVFTKLGFLTADLLSVIGIHVNSLHVVDIARAIGLLTAAALIGAILVRSPRYGVTKSVGLASVVLIICGPVIWPWYLPAGFALLAASGMRRYRPSVIVLVVAASIFVFPTSVDPIEGLSRYQHWLGMGAVVGIAGLCMGAQYVARLVEERRNRLVIDGVTIDQILVGSPEEIATSVAARS
jgi:hypothetical protein